VRVCRRITPLIAGLALGAGAAMSTLVAASAMGAPEPPAAKPEPKAIEFFENRIRPLLVQQCFACHTDKNVKGGLRMDSLAALSKGGDSGPAVVPGRPEKSLLITAVAYTRDNLRMPPQGKLKPQQIADLTTWVQMGAAWPTPVVQSPKSKVQSPRAGRDLGPGTGDVGLAHWAFQRGRSPRLPAVKNSAWVKTPVDAFILAKLEAAGVKPAAPADLRTLIRRVTFDLTGLPPTPEEVEAFLEASEAEARNERTGRTGGPSPSAYARLIDRLLASPAYGERWGRHWLDVARYADSNGLDENTHFANAWRYRDYVIDSFNKDKPYDQFIREQLAGDLLPQSQDEKTNHERLIATGFLSLGPKVLAEPDKQKMVMDIVDEQIDTVGKAFMGLTVGCARCHDHKFDPIPTKDYYALAGIFKSTRTMETLATVARVYERPLGTPEAVSAQQQHEAVVKKLFDRMNKAKTDEAKTALQAELKELQAKAPPEVPMCIAVEEAKEIGNVRVHVRGDTQNLGEEAPRVFLKVVAGEKQAPIGGDRSGRLDLAEWLARPDHPLTARVMVNRIWEHHFGEGIVRSPDNFGKLGDLPTHPELLDFLSAVFVASPGSEWENGRMGEWERRNSGASLSHSPTPPFSHSISWRGAGWSVKNLHRLILLSNAYQMSSAYDPKSAKADPENRLFWRFNRRRLEVEAIRDSILAVSGTLDRKAGGTLLKAPNFAYITNDQSNNTAAYDTPRRSIYLPVIRNAVYDVFQVFDFVEPSFLNGKRSSTTVAPQALFLLNGEMVLESAAAFADQLLKLPELDDAGRLRAAYLRAYGRPAAGAEVASALNYLRAYEDRLGDTDPEKRRRLAWRSLCQIIFASNEFVYLN